MKPDLGTFDVQARFLQDFFGPCVESDIDENQKYPIFMGS